MMAPVVIDKLAAKNFQPRGILSRLADLATDTDHVLVIIDLSGGNDGLNTVVPVDQYSKLSNVRANVLIPENKLLALNGTTTVKLHPSLTGLRDLYNNGKLKIIQNVGYPNQNYSHFRSTDIWFSGSDADKYVSSGFVGRYLGVEYPNFPVGYPNTSNPDPLGIQIGSILSLMFQGSSTNMGMAINNPNDIYNPIPGISDTAPSNRSGEQLEYVRLIAAQTSAYGKVIKAAADKVTTQGTYPNTDLANQLKVVAKLIKGGLKTRIYMVSLGGFDTHANQTDKTDKTLGAHANLLSTLDGAIAAFQSDCEGLGISDRVVGITISEFGRRIKSNDSNGTDHGSAAPVFLFGKPVDGGKILGNNPNIPSSTTVDDNLTAEFDFRSVYSSILKDWFCLSDSDTQTVMLKNFNTLGLFKQSCSVSNVNMSRFAGEKWLKCFPNPASSLTNVVFKTQAGTNTVELVDISGRVIKTLYHQSGAGPEQRISVDVSDLKPGQYLFKISNLSGSQSVWFQKV